MQVKKIIGANVREALNNLRLQLGQNAIILSNRTVNGVVEILAVPNDVVEEIARLPDAFERHSPRKSSRVVDDGWDSEGLGDGEGLSQVMSELKDMRSSFENRLSEIAWETATRRDPTRAFVIKEMLAGGFSALLARYLSDKQPKIKDGEDPLSWIKTTLSRNLLCLGDDSQMMDEGGVFALVGPTGVGKTTTTAKLAARCVMTKGPEKLGLITTDSYRIGAFEQLRIYGKILNVMVHSVKDDSDLRLALKELGNKHTILIDTVGMSQRDQMVAEQIAMLDGTGKDVKRILCLNATSSGETLNEVIKSYSGNGLAGCILTKMDEAATIGGVLDIIVRNKLKVFYVANGQKVPEDISLAGSVDLIDRAFKLKNETASFHLKDSEISLVAGSLGGVMDKSLRGINLG